MNELTEWFNDPFIQELLNQFLHGEITWLTGIVWVAIAAGISVIGGAIGGVLLAGKSLGYQLAAMIGGLFGPTAVIPATIIGLVVLQLP